MRRDDALLDDMLLAAERIGRYIVGMDREAFLADEKTQAAVARDIAIMGEAASRVSGDLKSAHPEVPWRDLADLRNFYIHAYHAIMYEKVWYTATGLVRRVREAVSAILSPREVVSHEDEGV